MKNGILKRCFSFFLCYFLAVFYTVGSANAFSYYDGERAGSHYDASTNRCNTGSIEYNPFWRNKDLNWELTNPYCAAYIAGVGTAMVAAGVAAHYACRATNAIGAGKATFEEAQEWEWDSPILTPSVARKLVNRYSRCTSRWSEFATWSSLAAVGGGAMGPYYSSQATMASKDGVACCASVTAYAAAVAAALGSLAIMWKVAKDAFEKSYICGNGWNKWEQQCKDAEQATCSESEKIWVKTKGDYQKCLTQVFSGVGNAPCSGINSSTKITNKNYREFIFGGIEIEDNECKNPWKNDTAKITERLGYASEFQKYYARGGGESISFACHRFLSADPSDKEAIAAFECCKKRSQEATCVHGFGALDADPDNAGNHLQSEKFCKVGERCKVAGVTYEVYDSRSTPNYLCVKTYSLCPYNHLLGGGTEKYSPDSNDRSVTTNTCQYMYHCTKRPILPYVRTSSLEGGFISSSCKDFKGDSQNFYGYNASIIQLNTKSFSAPIAQCFKETLENIMMNRGGDTQCANPDEAPVNGVCLSGDYNYRKGFSLKGDSVFVKLQSKLQSLIKLILVLSIVMFGVMILFAVPQEAIEKKKLLPYIVKIGLVLYFATGDAWQSKFMEGVLNSSTFLSEMVFNVDETGDQSRLDGCQFPRYNYADDNPDTKYNNPAYPPMKGYLKIWDTLDCKLAKALGFGPEMSVPNIIMMIIAGLFTYGLGLVFVVASLLFAFLLIAVIIRALHIFLLSVISMVILIYVSPLTIAAVMFERTKGIFQGWWKQLLGFALQPMILFAYLSIMITIFDQVTIGPDAKFVGNGKSEVKTMLCGGEAANTSLYCIFKVPNLKTNHALEVIGIGIPFIASMNTTKLNAIIKGALLMFIFYSFMDKISYFAKKLVGGAELKGEGPSVGGMAKKAFSIGSGLRERAQGALAKHVFKEGSAVRRAAGNVRDIVKDIGSKGKAGRTAMDARGSNTTSSSGDGSNTASSSGSGSNAADSGGGGSNTTT